MRSSYSYKIKSIPRTYDMESLAEMFNDDNDPDNYV